MELWDLYDNQRRLIGKTHFRGKIIPEGCYHLVVHVWIRNSKGEYLISQRSANRPTFPLMWECVGGSALHGEDSLSAALREVKEEVGIALEPQNGKVIHSLIGRIINSVRSSDILDVWLFQYDGDVLLTDATSDEVTQVQWMTFKQINHLFKCQKLVHTLEYFFKLQV